MGLEIRYCDLCRSRISPSDIEAGKALAEPRRSLCPECCKKEGITPERVEDQKNSRGPSRAGRAETGLFSPFAMQGAEKPTKRRVSPPSRLPQQEKDEAKAPPPPRSETRQTSRSTRTPAPKKSNQALLVGGLAGAAILLAVIVAALVMGQADSGGEASSKNHGDAGDPKKTDRKDAAERLKESQAKKKQAEALKLFKEVSDFDKQNPVKWAEAREKYAACLEKLKGTEFEKRIVARLEEGDELAARAAESAFSGVEEDFDRFLCEKNFDRAVSLFGDLDRFSGHQALLSKAIEMRTRVLAMKNLWNEARAFPLGEKLDFVQENALNSLYAEAGFDLEDAPADLAEWKRGGDALWTFENGVLRGIGATGAGELSFGTEQWTDFAVDFEFQATDPKQLEFLIHCEGEPSSFGLGDAFTAGEWYHARFLVWGEYLVARFYQHVRQHAATITKSCESSTRGGFGFRLKGGKAEAQLRKIRFRRLAQPDRPWIAPSSEWHDLYEPERDLQSASVDFEEGCEAAWSIKDGLMVGSSRTGGGYMALGGPSWMLFEFSLEVRRAPKGFLLGVKRPADKLSARNRNYLQASFELPPQFCPGDGWKQITLQVTRDKALLLAEGKQLAEAGFLPLNAVDVPQPFRIGFSKSQAGGALETRQIRVLVHERGGGF